MLKKAGLTMDDVMAEAFAKFDSFECFDRMLASAEARRNNAYARLIVTAQHSAPQCGEWFDEFEDAEFRDVETGELIGRTLS